MEDDYDIEDNVSCPKCGHSPLHSRSCASIFCEGGFIDASEDDPINFAPGECEHACPECRGTDIERWCPGCGENLSGVKLEWDEEEYDDPKGWGDRS